MLTRLTLVSAALAVFVAPPPASAGDRTAKVVCEKQHPTLACQLSAGRSDDGDDSNANNPDSGADGTSAGDQSGPWCVYRQTNPSAATVAALGGQPPGAGAWYVKTCYTDGGIGAALVGPEWIANTQTPVVSPEALALEARTRLTLPTVRLMLSPAGDQLVGLPTWLALDPASWGALSSTASVPGVSVTATARPTTVTWAMGDGGRGGCQVFGVTGVC